MLMNTVDKKIINIALPSIMGFLGLILFESADIYWIGKIGTKAQAAVAASSFVHWGVFTLMNFTTIGCMALVGRFFGAKNHQDQFQVIKESFWLSLLFAIILMILLKIFIVDLFLFMGLDPETLEMAKLYFHYMILALPVSYLFNLQGQIFNGMGDTKASNLIMFFVIMLNIVVDPLIIFGYGPFPKLGIQGAAIATFFAECIGLILRYRVLIKKNYVPEMKEIFNFSSFKFVKSIVFIGAPSAFTNLTWCLVYMFLTNIITKFGMPPLAALNIGHRIEAFPHFFAVGFSIAVSSLVSQSYGRGSKDEIMEVIKRGLFLISILLGSCSLVFIFFSENLVRMLTSDPEVIKHGANYIRIVGFFEMFLGWETLFEGAFNGLGNGRPFMIVRMPLMILRYPLSYLMAFSFSMGTMGVWWAVSLTTFVSGLILPLVFILNKKNKDIFEALSSESSA